MNSQRFSLNWLDAYKGILMFIITSVVVTVGSAVMQPNFDIFSADWATILKGAANTAVIATFSYLIKNFFSGSTVY